MKIFILLKNSKLIITSKKPDPFNLKLGWQKIALEHSLKILLNGHLQGNRNLPDYKRS